MATKSILKDIDIRDGETAKSLIRAFEQSEKKKQSEEVVSISRTVSETASTATLQELIRG